MGVVIAKGQITVFAYKDGEDAYAVSITPPIYAVVCDTDGNPFPEELGPFSKAIFSVVATKGESRLKLSYSTSNAAKGLCYWRIKSQAGLVLKQVAESSNSFYLSDITSDSAGAIIEFDLEGKLLLESRLSVTKQKAGASSEYKGQWQTNLYVPYLGIVRMGGKSWQCITKTGTRNPPLWTYTDNDSNRLLQTQDGGETYGYVLTGETNRIDYVQMAADGEQGLPGCITRKSEWKAGVEYRNDEQLEVLTRYIDIVLVRDSGTATGWRAYKCKKTHVSSSGNAPPNGTVWEEFGLNTTSIFTSLIIAKDAHIDFVHGNELLIKKDDGTVTAGLSGSQSGQKVRIWAGGANPDTAPFRVTEAGKMIATDADIKGHITATSGSFTGSVTAYSGKIGGFTIEKGNLFWKGYDYIGRDSRSVRIGVTNNGTDGLVDLKFNAATTGRFGVKCIGSNAGGACIYASVARDDASAYYPDFSNTYAAFFDGRVFVNEHISSRLNLADSYGVITSRNADGTMNYYEGVDLDLGTMKFKKGLLVSSAN